MKRWFVVAFAMLGFACGVHAQVAPQVVDTTVCDVVKKPAPFDGKMVRIKGTVIAGFDQFAIKDATDPNCGYPVNTIRPQYPQGTKGKAGAAAIVSSQRRRTLPGNTRRPRGQQ